MVLLLRNHEIRGLMDLPEYIDAVEAGYREIGLGAGIGFPRESLYIEGDRTESFAPDICQPAPKPRSNSKRLSAEPGRGGHTAIHGRLAHRARNIPVPLRYQ